MTTERARVLLTVKAAPELSKKYGETVCVAGVRLDGHGPELIRLYPVTWSWFHGSAHPKYQVLEIDIARHSGDQRPESYRPDLDSGVVIEHIKSTAKARRAQVLNALPQATMCDLNSEHGWGRRSLALVVPRSVIDVIVTEDDVEEETHSQLEMFAGPYPKIEHCPLRFRYHYTCWADGCNGHKQSIIDWEISEAWRKWRHIYPRDYVYRIRAKWMKLADPSRQPAFFVGNQHQAPKSFLVLGVARDITRVEPTPADPTRQGATPARSGDSRRRRARSTGERLF